jgi:hypothetical protein
MPEGAPAGPSTVAWFKRPVPLWLAVLGLGGVPALVTAAALTIPRDGRLPDGERCIINAALGTIVSDTGQHVTVFQGSIVALEGPAGPYGGWTAPANPTTSGVLQYVPACGDAQSPPGRQTMPFEAVGVGQTDLTYPYIAVPMFGVPSQEFSAIVTVIPDPRPIGAAVLALLLAAAAVARYRLWVPVWRWLRS